ncbi:hypothetical protein D3C71_1249970 [compost metagenome]
MRDHHGCRADLLLDAAQFELHLFAQLGVQVGQRFVQQQHGRPDDQRARQRHALALAARELAREAVGMLVQLHQRQRLAHARLALGAFDVAHLQAEGHVVGNGQVRKQRVALEHDPQAARVRLGVGNVAPVQRDGAPGHVGKAGDHLQGRRLAATGRPQQRDEFALFDRQAQVGDDAQVAVVLGDVVQPQK